MCVHECVCMCVCACARAHTPTHMSQELSNTVNLSELNFVSCLMQVLGLSLGPVQEQYTPLSAELSLQTLFYFKLCMCVCI